MKSGGMSAHQIIAPLIVASLIVAGISFTFNERIVARATAALDAWQKVEYAHVPPPSGVRTNVWVRADTNLINAMTVNGRGNAVRLDDVKIYGITNNRLAAIVSADHARPTGQPGQWLLQNARRFEVNSGRMVPLGDIASNLGAAPDRFTLGNVDGNGLSVVPLRNAIAELQAAGRPTNELETILWHKFAAPLSAVLMPLLGAVAGFGLARSGKLFIRLVIGMGLGFAYFVADNFGVAMGNLGAYPPWLAAWGPFFLFLLIGELILVRSEE